MSLNLFAFIERIPILESSTERKIRRLKRELVLQLFLEEGDFWDDVRRLRREWSLTPSKEMPLEERKDTYIPMSYLPAQAGESFGAWFKHGGPKFLSKWHASLRPLIEKYVPENLKSGAAWNEFFGACAMCDPPEHSLIEFSDFGELVTTVFWPVVEGDDADFDPTELYRMVSPPIERRMFKESAEDGDVFMEYLIKPSADTTREDVINAFRGIRAAYRQPCEDISLQHEGGRPSIDPLVALQCAVLHGDYNETDPEDGRVRLWSYKRLAKKFFAYGVRNERSAKEHVSRGREFKRLS